PSVAHWNLYRLASSLLSLGVDAESLKAQLAHFEPAFLHAYRDDMRKKLGLIQWEPADEELVDDWWALLHGQHADFTLSFRGLAGAPKDKQAFVAGFEDTAAAQAWLDRYVARLSNQSL